MTQFEAEQEAKELNESPHVSAYAVPTLDDEWTVRTYYYYTGQGRLDNE